MPAKIESISRRLRRHFDNGGTLNDSTTDALYREAHRLDEAAETDLETVERDSDDYHWRNLKKVYSLTETQTWHEWLLLSYKGVKIYSTQQDDPHGDGWLLLHPEPRYRAMARGSYGSSDSERAMMFTASGLPTYQHWDHDDPKNKGVYHSHYDWDRKHSIPAIKKAIDKGMLTQKGCFDSQGKPLICR